MHTRFLILATAGLLAGTADANAAPKKVLLISSGPDGHPPASHEYTAGLGILAKCLKPVAGIETTLATADARWKDGPDLIGRSDGVVLFLSEGAQWLSADEQRLTAIRQLARRGGGLSVIHWGMGTRAAEPVAPFIDLFGGCHGGPDRKYQVLETDVAVADRKHPIAAGINDFKIRDEFYYRIKFGPADRVAKPLLTARIDGRDEPIAWTWERPDGGRSFGFTGLHFHENWKREPYRRLVAQAVLWRVQLPVPANGLAVDLPDPAYLLEKK